MRERPAIVAAVAALAAMALGGCTTRPAAEQRPPVPIVGSFAGPAWRAIAPALGTTIDLRSGNPCASGRPRCMDEVVSEMSRRLEPLARRCDHLAPFALMYLELSRQVRARVRSGAYRSPPYVTHLDAVFATLYFHAVDAWRSGERASVPRAWRMAFAAARDRRVSALGDMLLGMNAHISRDLPYALAAVGLRLPGGADAGPDVEAINTNIERTQRTVVREEERRFDPAVGRGGAFRAWIRPEKVPALIAAWRAEAAGNARRLLAARSAAERERVETAIDANAALRALFILRETRYANAARGTRARDRYCARRAAA